MPWGCNGNAMGVKNMCPPRPSVHKHTVATPCCPAPVSAMMRFFPMRLHSSACPKLLLILCAPVWLRSSRLR